jgi:hypothetical protein
MWSLFVLIELEVGELSVGELFGWCEARWVERREELRSVENGCCGQRQCDWSALAARSLGGSRPDRVGRRLSDGEMPKIVSRRDCPSWAPKWGDGIVLYSVCSLIKFVAVQNVAVFMPCRLTSSIMFVGSDPFPKDGDFAEWVALLQDRIQHSSRVQGQLSILTSLGPRSVAYYWQIWFQTCLLVLQWSALSILLL